MTRLPKKAPEPFTLFKKDICSKVEDDYTLGMLNKIWEVYGDYTASHLSEITHLPGSPWDKKYHEFKAGKTYDDNLKRSHHIDKIEITNEAVAVPPVC